MVVNSDTIAARLKQFGNMLAVEREIASFRCTREGKNDNETFLVKVFEQISSSPRLFTVEISHVPPADPFGRWTSKTAETIEDAIETTHWLDLERTGISTPTQISGDES